MKRFYKNRNQQVLMYQRKKKVSKEKIYKIVIRNINIMINIMSNIMNNINKKDIKNSIRIRIINNNNIMLKVIILENNLYKNLSQKIRRNNIRKPNKFMKIDHKKLEVIMK
mgnify:CR=1 FL=1